MSNKVKRALETRLVGSSESLMRVKDHISRVSMTDATVLIQGESGTGKEVVARLVLQKAY